MALVLSTSDKVAEAARVQAVLTASATSVHVTVLSMPAVAPFKSTTGLSLTPVILMVLVTPVLVCAPTASLLASVTAQVIVRDKRVAATVGS